MRDAQLVHLIRVLKKGFIWALNIGENFKLSAQAWNTFAEELPSVATSMFFRRLTHSHLETTVHLAFTLGDLFRSTHVTHMYASEPHFGGITDKLKMQMRKSIRENR